MTIHNKSYTILSEESGIIGFDPLQINLIKNKAGRLDMRIKVRLKEDRFVWLIAKLHRNKTFYVVDVDKPTNTVLWTQNANDAMHFAIESSIQQFMHSYFKNRKDIYLVHMYLDDTK